MHVRVSANVSQQPERLHITKRVDDENVGGERCRAPAGPETFARAVFEGPVLRNKKKIAKNIGTHAAGKGV